MKEILNVEIKAKCNNSNELFEKLNELGADYKGEDHQIDTYFNCDEGRLKLRQGNIENSLIFYKRENKAGSNESTIHLERVKKDSNLKNVLTASNGVKVEVDKKRKILFIENVKFHIDTVKGLGSFMEIEAIDETGDIGLEKLTEQCNHYIKTLGIKDIDFVEVSYSDLLLETFPQKIQREANAFLNVLNQNIISKGLDLEPYFLDHLCYRAETQDEYNFLKEEFTKNGELLIASEIGGREIASFKLLAPIKHGNREINVIELPSPKKGSFYATGFEHAEFVIDQSFEWFQDKYQEVDFDTSATKKAHNPELRVKFADASSIKLHHKSLEEVINIEKKAL